MRRRSRRKKHPHYTAAALSFRPERSGAEEPLPLRERRWREIPRFPRNAGGGNEGKKVSPRARSCLAGLVEMPAARGFSVPLRFTRNDGGGERVK
ncbi:MAG: hypothetical protein LBK47_08745 [Prevotellaceae bacterium]|nr:hypothetical protein [Prevotellaceae bacterium]